MKKTEIVVIGFVAVAVFIGLYFFVPNKSISGATPSPSPSASPTSTPMDTMVRVTTPVTNALVRSPLRVEGQARGTWYFEASFPIRIIDANGKELGVVAAHAGSDWMTTDFVPFTADLVFSTPTTATGTLILEKDNPSGLAEHADERRIPIRFDMTAGLPQRSVKLYYYNPTKDHDARGTLLCSAKGLEVVDRKITITTTPIQDTIQLLLDGSLSADERARGTVTEFPLAGFDLKGASLNNGTLTLEFKDPQNKSSGGSCRVSTLRAQVEATAKQFPEVKTVRIIPENIFQP